MQQTISKCILCGRDCKIDQELSVEAEKEFWMHIEHANHPPYPDIEWTNEEALSDFAGVVCETKGIHNGIFDAGVRQGSNQTALQIFNEQNPLERVLSETIQQMRDDLRKYFKERDLPVVYAELMEQPTHFEIGFQKLEKVVEEYLALKKKHLKE